MRLVDDSASDRADGAADRVQLAPAVHARTLKLHAVLVGAMTTRSFWLLTFGGALAATIGTYWERSHPTPAFLEPVVDALNIVHAAVVGFSSMLSRSHSPPLALEYGVLFASYVLLFLILLGIVRMLSR